MHEMSGKATLATAVTYDLKSFMTSVTLFRGQYYKTFYGRKLRLSIIS
jgi:hypothetical protein